MGQRQAGGAVRRAGVGQRQRDSLVGLLALATGSFDVIGFTRLGGVFTSVMTGNVALLGLAAGRRDASLAVHTGVAFLGYIVGAAVGAGLAGSSRPGQPVWPRRVSLTLAVEMLALLLFVAAWELSRQSPKGDLQLGMLALASAAMGLQSAAVARLAIPGLSSTYLTGTITGLVAALVNRKERGQVKRGLLALAALALGAAVGGLLVVGLSWAAPLWAVAVVGTVLVAALSAGRDGAKPQG